MELDGAAGINLRTTSTDNSQNRGEKPNSIQLRNTNGSKLSPVVVFDPAILRVAGFGTLVNIFCFEST